MSSHVFSLLFKVVLNSTLSWWKTICFLALVLLWLNTGLGEHERRGTGAGVGGGGMGHPAGSELTALGSGYQPSLGEPSLHPAGRCWGWDIAGLSLHGNGTNSLWVSEVCFWEVFPDLSHPWVSLLSDCPSNFMPPLSSPPQLEPPLAVLSSCFLSSLCLLLLLPALQSLL